MEKEEILLQLRAAKAAHISWVQRAKFLIEGFTINESSIPVNSTECKFGKWFYTEGQRLNDIRNNPIESMTNIEELHQELHDVYLKIYKVYYETGKPGFFSKIFGKKNKVSDGDIIMAKEYFHEIENISKELIKALNIMERRITVVAEEEIKAI